MVLSRSNFHPLQVFAGLFVFTPILHKLQTLLYEDPLHIKTIKTKVLATSRWCFTVLAPCDGLLSHAESDKLQIQCRCVPIHHHVCSGLQVRNHHSRLKSKCPDTMILNQFFEYFNFKLLKFRISVSGFS